MGCDAGTMLYVLFGAPLAPHRATMFASASSRTTCQTKHAQQTRTLPSDAPAKEGACVRACMPRAITSEATATPYGFWTMQPGHPTSHSDPACRVSPHAMGRDDQLPESPGAMWPRAMPPRHSTSHRLKQTRSPGEKEENGGKKEKNDGKGRTQGGRRREKG